MEINAKVVSELRRRTGLPMMKCKQALVEAGGDVDKAVENLRKAGAKNIDKLQGREMKEGLVFTRVDDSGAAAVAVLCETDFVARGEAFLAFGEALAARLFDAAPGAHGEGEALDPIQLDDGRTVGEHLKELIGSKIRENMKVGSWACFKPERGLVSVYVHHNRKIASLVELEGDGLASQDAVAELGNDLGMQIAFHAGLKALRREELDAEWVAKEREIFLAQVENAPEDKRKQIAEGKLNKSLKEVVLLDQPFIKNEKESVQKHVEAVAKQVGTAVAVRRFARIAAGA